MTVRTTRKHIAPVLAAVAVVAAIGSAPVAAADEPVAPDQPSPPSQSCAQLGAPNTNANHRATLS